MIKSATKETTVWWVEVRHDDGTGAMLDQSRMRSIECATKRGWLK